MADRMEPAAALATNPYLLLQPASPDKWSMLGSLLMGAGAGISQADASGRSWASGIAPGLMTGLQMSNAMQKQAEDQSLRRTHLAMMLEQRRPWDEAARARMRMAANEAVAKGLDKAAATPMDPLKSVTTGNVWVPLGEGNGRMYLGPTYDPTKAYQRNPVTGEIRPIVGPEPAPGSDDLSSRQWR
ncbi:MAG: hypothetical protein HYX38_35210 [Rhodospirillales bacterium]|nr:hypothetical protein [Rhodospirillales bacterium]